jgi:hypothetical protein
MVVLALLLGLFAMHGLPAGQAGCHGSAPVMSMATHSTGSHLSMPGGMGEMCVSLQPGGRPGHPLPILLLLGFLVLLATGATLFAEARPGRAPPRSGVALLRWTCVSRT